jgi:L-aspartate oxidase
LSAGAEVRRCDVVVLGAGAAGLSAALGLPGHKVHVITKGRLGSTGSSGYAQGGIAAALGRDDSPAQHAADTLAVAGGLADVALVEILAREGPQAVLRVIDWGGRFDRASDGSFALGREAAHSRPRILHAADATGAELVRALSAALRAAAGAHVYEQEFACELLLDGRRVRGVRTRDAAGRTVVHLARAVVLATGGIGHLYAHTTNPPEATGDGLALAARAGVELVDLEFVQFHPTALAVGADPMPLLTEALRGAGASVVDEHGRRFLFDHDPAGELAPRDIVARAIARQRLGGGSAFLDARGAVGAEFPQRFPTVFALCQRHGLDPRSEPIPVAPAAHYHMGGVRVDAWGRSSQRALWACGEVASTGVHGANRLASNSLLEALVFGARVAQDVATSLEVEPQDQAAARDEAWPTAPIPARVDDTLVEQARRTLWTQVGLLRDERGLAAACTTLASLRDALPPGESEAHNLVDVGLLIATAARLRRESRGSHFRSDHPQADPACRRRLSLRQSAQAGLVASWGDLPVEPALAGASASAGASVLEDAR